MMTYHPGAGATLRGHKPGTEYIPLTNLFITKVEEYFSRRRIMRKCSERLRNGLLTFAP